MKYLLMLRLTCVQWLATCHYLSSEQKEEIIQILSSEEERCEKRRIGIGIYRSNAALDVYLDHLKNDSSVWLRARDFAEKSRFEKVKEESEYRNDDLRAMVQHLRKYANTRMKADPASTHCEFGRPVKDACGLIECTSCFGHHPETKIEYKQILHPADGETLWLLDDYYIRDKTNNTERQYAVPIIQPRKVMEASAVGLRSVRDKNQFGMYGSVQYDQGLWRIWLKASKLGMIAVESSDGISNWKVRGHWEKFADISSAISVSRSGWNGTYIAAYQCNYCAFGGYQCLGYFGLCLAQSKNGGIDDDGWHLLNKGKPVITATKEMPLNADTQSQIFRKLNHFYVHTRIGFSTNRSWRDFRGIAVLKSPKIACSHLVTDPFKWNECALLGNPQLASQQADEHKNNWQPLRAWKLDQESVTDEGLIRQAYTLGVTYSSGIYLGLVALINKPKDFSEKKDFDSDTMDTYLVTSRDAENWNLESIYNRTPLMPRQPNSWFSGIVMPAANFVTHNNMHRLYFEGASVTHESRHASTSTIGLTAFHKHRISGFRPKGGSSVLLTKSFVLPKKARYLLLNLDYTHRTNSNPFSTTPHIVVDIVSPACQSLSCPSLYTSEHALPRDINTESDMNMNVPVSWPGNVTIYDILRQHHHYNRMGKITFALRFHLHGDIMLYTFEFTSIPSERS